MGRRAPFHGWTDVAVLQYLAALEAGLARYGPHRPTEALIRMTEAELERRRRDSHVQAA